MIVGGRGGVGWLNRLWNFFKWRISIVNLIIRILKILILNYLKKRKFLLLVVVNDFMKYFGYCNVDIVEGFF